MLNGTMPSAIILSVDMLSVIILSIIMQVYHFAKCRYAECHYAKCHYAECHYAECRYDECRYDEVRQVECRGATQTLFVTLTQLDELTRAVATMLNRTSVRFNKHCTVQSALPKWQKSQNRIEMQNRTQKWDV